MQKMTFKGSIDEFRQLLRNAGVSVTTTTDMNGFKRFLTSTGVRIDWWPDSKKGSVHVTGADFATNALREQLREILFEGSEETTAVLHALSNIGAHASYFAFTVDKQDGDSVRLVADWWPAPVIVEDHGDGLMSLETAVPLDHPVDEDAIHQLDRQTRVAQIGMFDDTELALTARYEGGYDRSRFGIFFTRWCADLLAVGSETGICDSAVREG